MWREGRGLKQDHLGRLVSQGLKMALAYTAMLTHTLGRICVEWTRERNRVILMDTTPCLLLTSKGKAGSQGLVLS